MQGSCHGLDLQSLGLGQQLGIFQQPFFFGRQRGRFGQQMVLQQTGLVFLHEWGEFAFTYDQHFFLGTMVKRPSQVLHKISVHCTVPDAPTWLAEQSPSEFSTLPLQALILLVPVHQTFKRSTVFFVGFLQQGHQGLHCFKHRHMAWRLP